jgi:small subunit ribosomal protein S1
MVDRILLRELDVPDADAEEFDMDLLLGDRPGVEAGGIVPGKVIEVVGDQVVVDVGYKSEGLVPLNEWDPGEPPPQPGDEIEVLLEGMDDDTGEVVLSRKKAHRMRAWERVISVHRVGDVVTGKVTRKIKGGLLVDIGINAFLPASQVDIRRPPTSPTTSTARSAASSCRSTRTGATSSSRARSLIETERVALREGLLAEIAVGQVRTGHRSRTSRLRRPSSDLGGIDGLLHITTWAGSA